MRQTNLPYGNLRIFLRHNKFKKIFILTGKNSFYKSSADKILEKTLIKQNKKIFFKKSLFPEIKELKIIIKNIRDYKPDLIIAIGGGSVMDYAKIANVKNIETKLKTNITLGNNKLKDNYTTLIAIPTTAGSGSEVTSNAVIYIRNTKYSVEGNHLIPNYYYLMPELVIGNKKTIKSSSGFDAISQAVESMLSVKSTKESLIYSKKSLEFSLKNYIKFLEKPSLNNASLMSNAAMLAGKAISISKTTAPHAVSYPFTALYNISHGHAVSLTFEKFLKFNYLNQNKSICAFDLEKRYLDIFKIFKVKNIYELEKYIKNLKTKAKLSDDFNLLNIDIKNNYHKILDGINIQRLKNNPILLKKKDIKLIILNKFY